MPEVPLVGRVRAALAAAADPVRAAGQQRYMKSAMPFRGVRMPEVRRIVNLALAQSGPLDPDAMVIATRELWDGAAYREERYAALAICRDRRHHAHQAPRLLPLYRHFVETGAWWDLVDETAHLVGVVLARNPGVVAPIMREWSREPDMWVRRVAIISQLGRGAGTDPALLADTIDPNLADTEFFIRKAIGWALRQYARTDPSWVRRYVAGHDLSALSRREAMKHLPADPG